MTTKQPHKTSAKKSDAWDMSLSEYAYRVIAEQYRRVAKREKKVMADRDPEDLHQMRVSCRRLRTALQVFHAVVAVPKAAGEKRVRNSARTLSKLRDLDVQLAALQQDYLPKVNASEQTILKTVCESLQQQRRHALSKARKALKGKRYRKLKAAYDQWLEQPQFEAVGQLSLRSHLPELLAPLLSHLLLHPGWLVPRKEALGEQISLLHDLRKVCKHVRYQAEFFKPFYSDAFSRWIKEVKSLQDKLGKLNDIQVLQELLTEELPVETELPELQAILAKERRAALSRWDKLRKQYLDAEFRYRLHCLILEPLRPSDPVAAKDRN